MLSGYEAPVKRNAFSCYTVADNVFGNDDDLGHNLEDRTVLLVDDDIFLLDENVTPRPRRCGACESGRHGSSRQIVLLLASWT